MKTYAIATFAALVFGIGCSFEKQNGDPGDDGAGASPPSSSAGECQTERASSSSSGTGGGSSQCTPSECPPPSPPVLFFVPHGEESGCAEVPFLTCPPGGRGIVCTDGGKSLSDMCPPGVGLCLEYSGTVISGSMGDVAYCCNACIVTN